VKFALAYDPTTIKKVTWIEILIWSYSISLS